ncbi:MAG: hypothetical protein OEV87_05965 [Phycisphaerae bacterium]|nr:hypothetical protein [Phycisphaerae bacterium]
MWLSKQIWKDPEAKEALGGISKLIKKYKDPTDIYKSKFFSADIGRLFRPKTSMYIVACLVAFITEVTLLSSKLWDISIIHEYVKVNLSISVSILVFGITFSQIARSLSESSKFASLTFLTVIFGILSTLLFPATVHSTISQLIYLLTTPFVIGGGVWCVISLIYIILEIIKCMDPETSVEYASKFAIRRLNHAFLVRVYLDTWMKKYFEILEKSLEKYETIHAPNSYYSLCLKPDQEMHKYVIQLKKEGDFCLGYRDYNLNKIKNISEMLEKKKQSYI